MAHFLVFRGTSAQPNGGMAEVQVIGVPSQRYGEEVMAWIKLRDGAT